MSSSDMGEQLCAVEDMVKNYSLPATPAPSADGKAPTAAEDEGGNAGEQEPAGNAGRHGKRGRRSHLHSSPSPVKRPPDAVAPGDYPYIVCGDFSYILTPDQSREPSNVLRS